MPDATDSVAEIAGGGTPSGFPEAFAARLLRPIVLETPEKVPLPPGWNGHIPFAFWLVDMLRPALFVELGTHMGNSYLAFCQAVQRLQTGTRCCAVDTWRGDEHAGLYDDSIFRELSAYHDARYSHFSRLMRSTFDEALPHFADGSIDLLHIDGMHTYEAVKHDFETWLPKLSARAVVIFHDIEVRTRDFEVWRFWGEITQRYPSFTFLHSNGLGVLAVGRPGPALEWLTGVANKDSNLTSHVRAFFSITGGNISATAEASRLAERERQLQAEVGEAKEQITIRDTKVGERDQHIIALDGHLRALTETLGQRDTKIHELNLTMERLEQGLATRQQQLDAIFASRSWRLTRPIRFASRLMRFVFPWPRRRHELRSEPIHELEDLGGGRYRSLGVNPQLRLDSTSGRAPRGWAFIRYGVTELSTRLSPTLHAFGGAKPRLLASIPLPAIVTGVAEILVRLPDETTALRFDPTDRLGDFSLGAITIQEVSPLSIALRALRRYPKGFVKAALKLPQIGVSEFKNRITELFKSEVANYRFWVQLYDSRTLDEEAAIRQHCATLASTPKISVVMPVWNTPEPYLRAAIESVLAQLYENWELCIADDASSEPHVAKTLREYADREPRIKLAMRSENGRIAKASNSALALATGDFIALLDHDDVLPNHALYMIAVELNAYPDADVIYSDEDKIDEKGNRFDPFFKPDWDPERIYAQNYVSHLGVYRASLVKTVGGFREGFEGSQDYDLTLRIVAKTTSERIRHIPFVLYHWRIFPGAQTFSSTQAEASAEAARRAIRSHFVDKGEAVEVIEGRIRMWHRAVRRPPTPAPRVSLIVPTRDRVALLKACVDGLLHKTDYPDLEVIIVDNESREPETLRYLTEISGDPRVRVLRIEGAFNFSALNNSAVRIATGQIVGFINNDIEIPKPDWLTEMVAQIVPKDVGAVGAKLFYGNGTVQHAGVVLGVGGVANHIEKHASRSDPGYFAQLQIVRSVSVVTAACMLIKREIFETVGGFDEINLAVAFNDVDLCLRVREAGYRIVYTPYAELDHLESASRGSDVIDPAKYERFKREADYMRHRWGKMLENDPYFSPNLSLSTPSIAIAYPPRVVRPWLAALQPRAS